jgi:hypothetical protein
MTIQSWEPAQPGKQQGEYTITDDFLQRIVLFMGAQKGDDISTLLTSKEQNDHQPIMRLDKTHWFDKKEPLFTTDIIALIKFFTLAEMQLTGWTAEEKSPVIWLTKILRQKGEALDKDLLLWIKTYSDNKFLPHGAL